MAGQAVAAGLVVLLAAFPAAVSGMADPNWETVPIGPTGAPAQPSTFAAPTDPPSPPENLHLPAPDPVAIPAEDPGLFPCGDLNRVEALLPDPDPRPIEIESCPDDLPGLPGDGSNGPPPPPPPPPSPPPPDEEEEEAPGPEPEAGTESPPAAPPPETMAAEANFPPSIWDQPYAGRLPSSTAPPAASASDAPPSPRPSDEPQGPELAGARPQNIGSPPVGGGVWKSWPPAKAALLVVGSSLLLLPLAWSRLPRAARAAVASLFSRLDSESLLSHPRRQALLELVRANPGIRFEDARNRLALPNGPFQHHVAMLEARGTIQVDRRAGFSRLYAAEAVRDGLPMIRGLREAIVDVLRARPGMTQQEISRQLGKSKRVISYHIRLLRDQGVLQVERWAQKNRCSVRPATLMGLARSPPRVPLE